MLLGARTSGNDNSSHVRTMRPAPIINLALGRKAAATTATNHPQITLTGPRTIDNAWNEEGVSRNQFMREILSTTDIGGNDQNQQYNTAVESDN